MLTDPTKSDVGMVYDAKGQFYNVRYNRSNKIKQKQFGLSSPRRVKKENKVANALSLFGEGGVCFEKAICRSNAR